jgi:hypothetical protein
MRERAARIGGNLTLGSSSNSGTEIKLVIPGGIIFRDEQFPSASAACKDETLFSIEGPRIQSRLIPKLLDKQRK